MVVVVGWDWEGQGQGLLLFPGKTLLAGANGFQTQSLGAPSPGLLAVCWSGPGLALGEMASWGPES